MRNLTLLYEDPPLPGPKRTASRLDFQELTSVEVKRDTLHSSSDVLTNPTVSHFQLTRLSRTSNLLPEVHGEAHVPNVTLTVIEAAQNRHIRLVRFDAVDVVFHLPRFPTHNCIFT